ncbi:hypothetical protein E6P09_17840 (plasmid) [Haloferax mediterranei ATCC 33500]|uniref:Uncharacterized protein n=1 Tax=Haloferax mediterranei (strain ATCC 33500 / DSM 1411 / JCM 8866 / NBRC 14739 / NCIMB 2177 / R-4) TaxID=523841 RepID=I3R9W3_HALMT|nr:hypothetical protein [Haloferax mediterranei]AFK21023.1 hypothetical protein HFX_5189 [Haloferax mediterranei ATCC 33500]MDX5990001.1 hypothetical protein [Haloferax mediterranei ATCC 33500]QCQ77184.1 hypothetical protein E6P09_17840 [Haloferax mediterranei ATCC 33500]
MDSSKGVFRRQFSSAIASATLLFPLTGCINDGTQTSKKEGHEVHATNLLEHHVQFFITMSDKDENVVFKREYTLPPNSYNESEQVSETPDQMAVEYSGERQTYDYSPTVSCGEASTVSIIFAVTEDEGMRIMYGCRST